MCDPCEWMPVPRVKSGKRPGESRERNTAIHHWIFIDIRGVIESDEAMPYQLRIDPKRYYRQTEQDEKVGSLECCNVADLESFRSSPLAAAKPTAFRFCAVRLRHVLCETIKIGLTRKRSNCFGSILLLAFVGRFTRTTQGD